MTLINHFYLSSEKFSEAAPFLFGTEFAKKGKEMVDQVRAMRSTMPAKKQERKPPFFRGGPPSSRGGGGGFKRYGRGGAQNLRYRERPYQMGKGQPQKNKN